jgi:hypothetical protein
MKSPCLRHYYAVVHTTVVQRQISATGNDLLASSIILQNKIVTLRLWSLPGRIYGRIHADVIILL